MSNCQKQLKPALHASGVIEYRFLFLLLSLIDAEWRQRQWSDSIRNKAVRINSTRF